MGRRCRRRRRCRCRQRSAHHFNASDIQEADTHWCLTYTIVARYISGKDEFKKWDMFLAQQVLNKLFFHKNYEKLNVNA